MYWGAVHGPEGNLWCDIICHTRKPTSTLGVLKLRVPGKWKVPRFQYMEVFDFKGGKTKATVKAYQGFALRQPTAKLGIADLQAGLVFPLVKKKVEALLAKKGVE